MFWNVGRRSFWRDMDRLQREANRLMDSYSTGSVGTFPPVNIWSSQDEAVVTAELPGVDVDNLEISVVEDTVTISGSRDLPETGDNAQWHRHERWHGDFSRTLQLPFRINPENVDASFRNGVLSITLPRAEEDKPKRISVSAGEGES